MTKALRIPLLIFGLLVVGYAFIRSISISLAIPDEAVAATGGALSIIAAVIATILLMLLVVWVMSRIRIPARAAVAVAPMRSPAPTPTPTRREAREVPYGIRKIFGALVLAAIVFASTYVTFGSELFAGVMAAVLTIVSFSRYDTYDASLDNIFGLFLCGSVVLVLVLVWVAVGGVMAGVLNVDVSEPALWIWSVSILAAMGAHMLICCAGRMGGIRADVKVPRERSGLVLAAIAAVVIGLIVAFAYGVF